MFCSTFHQDLHSTSGLRRNRWWWSLRPWQIDNVAPKSATILKTCSLQQFLFFQCSSIYHRLPKTVQMIHIDVTHDKAYPVKGKACSGAWWECLLDIGSSHSANGEFQIPNHSLQSGWSSTQYIPIY